MRVVLAAREAVRQTEEKRLQRERFAGAAVGGDPQAGRNEGQRQAPGQPHAPHETEVARRGQEHDDGQQGNQETVRSLGEIRQTDR